MRDREVTQIFYHGTNARNAKCILVQGFNVGTYLATHLEDALGYGGTWVFEVAFPVHLVPKGNWQFTLRTRVLPESIVRLTRYNPSKIEFDNMVLRHMVCRSNQTKGEVDYTESDMRANPSHYTQDELIAYGVNAPARRKVSLLARRGDQPARRISFTVHGRTKRGVGSR